MKRIILAAGLCAAVLAPSAARAQDERETMVRSLVTQVAPTLQARGFAQTGSTTVGQLAASADGTMDVTLQAGKQYVVMGVCDGSCSDLDLTLFDGAGHQIATDVEKDDAPVVSVSPTATGTYRLKISMIVCTSDPCRYAIAAFAK